MACVGCGGVACVAVDVVVRDGSVWAATVATRSGSVLTTCCESDVFLVVCVCVLMFPPWSCSLYASLLRELPGHVYFYI